MSDDNRSPDGLDIAIRYAKLHDVIVVDHDVPAYKTEYLDRLHGYLAHGRPITLDEVRQMMAIEHEITASVMRTHRLRLDAERIMDEQAAEEEFGF